MPDGGPFGPASVVVFGLVAAVAWGAADFGGGLTTRRATLFGVVIVSQVVGMLVAAAAAIVRGEPPPSGTDIGWAALSGALAGVGILGLYGGLAIGRMGIVAPVTGVLAAIVPVTAGIALQGLPGAYVIAGIGLAILAVLLVSRVASPVGGRSGIELAVMGGIGLGLFNVTVAQVQEGLVFGPLVVVRAVEAGLITIVMLVARRPGRVPLRIVPAVALVGVLDMTGNAGYLFAEATGSIAVASVLTSLYPVTTVILAMAVLREPVTRSHAVGIVLALAAIVLISVGQVP
jgi:drug/metabolite transporter (DMT)-like permease